MNTSEQYQILRADEPIVPDGNWAGPAWENIAAIDIKHYMGDEPEHKPRTQAKLLYDDDFLYVIFRVEDRYIRAVARGYHSNVCLDSCVEFFFTPGADISLGYFNVEINCSGTMLFHYQIAPATNVTPLSKSECDRVSIFHSEPEFVEPEKQQPTVWIIEYRLPVDILKKYCPVTRPAAGVLWLVNFYKCADHTSHPHWLSWSVVDYPRPNFHLPEFFGTLEFK